MAIVNPGVRAIGACAVLCLLASGQSLAQTRNGPDDGETADRITATVGGRIHWDFAAFDNDARGTPNPDDTEFRRVWLDVSGRLFGLGYKVEADFAGLQDEFRAGAIEAKDVYLTRDFDSGRLTVGQFKQYFSLDDRTGSNYGSFLERGGAATTLAPLYRLGASWRASPGQMTWAASAYSLESINVWQAKGRALGGRITWAPDAADGRVLHLGLSAAHERHDHPGAEGAQALRIRPRPAGHLSDASRLTLVDFSAGRDTDVDKWSLEYAQVQGPWSWQGEFSGADFDDGAERGRVRGGYAFVSWFATGESRRYDTRTGRFTRIAGVNRKAGALEFALRYDTLGGSQHRSGQGALRDARTDAWTLAGNWYLRPNLRVMLDFIQSRNRDRLGDATLDRTRALTGRLQYDF